MKRRKIICMAYSVCFPFMAYCMDDHIPKINPKNPQAVIQITDEPIAADTTQNKKKPSPVPNIVIASQNSPGSTSRNLMKKRVTSNKELEHHIKKAQDTQRTARNTPPVRRAARKINIDNDEDDRMPITTVDDLAIGRQKRSILPKTLTQLTGKSVDDQKMYTEKEVWALIASCNPILYAFGEKHNLKLQELELFAACMEELEINPQLITEHAHAINNQPTQKNILQQVMDSLFGDPEEQHLDRLNKQYAKIKRERPEDYKVLLLELMKTVADQAEGQQANRSTIADTHTALQSQDLANQVTQTRLAVGGLLVAIITAIPGWATSMLQFFSPTNCTS